MKALILAAGFGTRLAPLTNSLPKCLVELAGRPLLQYWLSAFEASSLVTEIVINTHYLSEQVDEFIERYSPTKNIILKHEAHLLGTAGTIRSLKKWVGKENLMVVHGDNFTSLNLDHFIRAHLARPDGTNGTMGYFYCKDYKNCGIIKIDSFGKVVEFIEKPKIDLGRCANAAVYIFEPEVLEIIFDCERVSPDISVDIIPNLMGKLFAYKIDGFHVDVGSPKGYKEAQDIANKISKA